MNEKENMYEYNAMIMVILVLLISTILGFLLNYLISLTEFKINYDKCKITNVNTKNNTLEYACEGDLKIIQDIQQDDWDRIKKTFHCKYTGYDTMFKCDNDIQIKRPKVYLTEWYTFKDENHCKLIKIDKTVKENKNNWLCDNNINIYNDLYK